MEFVCGLPFDLDVSPKLTPYPTTLLTSIFMTPKDIYIKQLLGLGRGVPLYEPGKVHVGDVGFIDPRDGFFEKLYNIAEPHKDKRGCPPAIKLKKTKYNRKWGHFYMEKSEALGASSQAAIPKVPGQMQFEFSDIKQGECILIPGDDVELERLVETVGLPGYMDGHLSWIRKTYAGHDFSHKSLILVERTAKTDRWAIAVNTSSKASGKLSFNIASAGGATVWGEWSTSTVISTSGPNPCKSLVPLGITGDVDQTIFMRYIALCPPISFFGEWCFGFPRDSKPTPFHRLRATITRNKPDRRAVEEPEDTHSLPAATSGAGSASIEEGNDEE